MRPRLRDQYDEVIRPELQARFNYANLLQVPRLDKIVINMGVGEAAQDAKKITPALEELTLISGQKPVEIKAANPSPIQGSRGCAGRLQSHPAARPDV